VNQDLCAIKYRRRRKVQNKHLTDCQFTTTDVRYHPCMLCATPRAGMQLSKAIRVSRLLPSRLPLESRRWVAFSQGSVQTSAGTTTPLPDEALHREPKSPFYFEAGYALYAKRPSRPFPPPFLSPPSGSFSDPLSTHNRSRDRRPTVNGEMIRGVTNGDDAVLVGENFIGANDGVGAWATRPRGHAA
jgi:hypothetical protein